MKHSHKDMHRCYSSPSFRKVVLGRPLGTKKATDTISDILGGGEFREDAKQK